MNSLIHILFLSIALTFVSALPTLNESRTDIQCVKRRIKELDGLSPDQLFNLTQENLQIANQMVAKRAEIAKQNGLKCYYDFNTAYAPAVQKIMGPEGEKDVLKKARNDKEKNSALKEIATMTQMIRCDEEYRAKHSNDSVECNLLEKNGGALAENTLREPALETVMGIGGLALKVLSPPMASVVTQMKDLYKHLYANGKKCALNGDLPTDQRCRNLKIFNLELRRLGELGALAVASKLPGL